MWLGITLLGGSIDSLITVLSTARELSTADRQRVILPRDALQDMLGMHEHTVRLSIGSFVTQWDNLIGLLNIR